MEDIYYWIGQYGYIAIFFLLMLGIVGLPIPDETLLAFAGFLISRGDLNLVPTWLSAVAGSMTGITMSFIIGRMAGYIFIEKYGYLIHLNEENLDKVHAWFDKIGRWSLFVGYFIPGIRHVSAVAAGMTNLSKRSFALFAYSGAIFWCSLFLSIGYFFGEKWEEVFNQVRLEFDIGLAIVIGLLLLIYFINIIQRIHKTRGDS